jgi:hypothetical protein
VLPPLSGGLHCGTVEAWLEAYDQPVLPPVSGGLHCGGKKVGVGIGILVGAPAA